MLGELAEGLSSIFSIFAFRLPYKQRRAEENMEWVKQQEWFLNYTSDPKWGDMITNDKRMLRILSSFPNDKLIHDEKLQLIMKRELVNTYEMWKLAWKLK